MGLKDLLRALIGMEMPWRQGSIYKEEKSVETEHVTKRIRGQHCQASSKFCGITQSNKSLRVINKKQQNARTNTGTKMWHVEGVTAPGNQSKLAKNSLRDLSLSGVFAETYLWDHPCGRSEISVRPLRKLEVLVCCLT